VKVSTAKSPAEWHERVNSKGWGAFLHGVKRLDGVVRVGVTLLSPGREGAAAPKFERPVWIGFFAESEKPGEFTLVNFEPARAKEQRDQETNLLPGEDVRVIDPSRTAFLGREQDIFQLNGQSSSPVDARSAKWLDPYRTSDSALVRAAAVLKAGQLGAEVTPKEYADVISSVLVGSVQREAAKELEKLLGLSTEEIPVEELGALKKAGGGDEVKVVKDVAMVKGGGKTTFFTRGDAGWTAVKPKS
jgi:hypothetical protein